LGHDAREVGVHDARVQRAGGSSSDEIDDADAEFVHEPHWPRCCSKGRAGPRPPQGSGLNLLLKRFRRGVPRDPIGFERAHEVQQRVELDGFHEVGVSAEGVGLLEVDGFA